jgi:hypothetical protein
MDAMDVRYHSVLWSLMLWAQLIACGNDATKLRLLY